MEIERVQNERQFVGTLQSAEGGTATATLSRMPEQYPILEMPSEWLRKEGKEVAENVGKMLDEYAELFQELPRGGVKGRAIQHHIATLPGEAPEYKKGTYPLTDENLMKLKEMLNELVEKEFIVPSQSPVAAPVIFVGKKDGSLRLVIDYRPLNRITIKDDYPIPKIHDLINRLGKAKWFTKFDLQKGYYQVEIAEADQWKSAFRTRYGTYQFKVMPFGLSGAPSTFQRLMQSIFIKELDEFVAHSGGAGIEGGVNNNHQPANLRSRQAARDKDRRIKVRSWRGAGARREANRVRVKEDELAGAISARLRER
ncbi:retrotransposon nucleocapsid protein, partial [Cystoisospora suis]